MTTSLCYNAMTSNMNVICLVGNKRVSKSVPLDTLRRVGDCDIDALIYEAMSFPGEVIHMPKFTRKAHRRAA